MRGRETEILCAFRAAHWPPVGQPVCPRCHDGADVVVVGVLRTGPTPGLRLYDCRACAYRFTDLVGTPLESSHWPLRCWAWLALELDRCQAVERVEGYARLDHESRRRLRRWAARLQVSDLPGRWVAELHGRGITGRGTELVRCLAETPARRHV